MSVDFPAFPIISPVDANGHGPLHDPVINAGMTLRDWFAGQALPVLLADPNFEGDYKDIAECSYHMANAMLAAR